MRARLLVLALLVCGTTVGQTPSPYGIFGGSISSLKLPSGAPVGAVAFTSDQGMLVSNGTTWIVPGGAAPAYSFSTEQGANGVAGISQGAVFTDTSGPGAVTHETAFSFGASTFTTASAITTTNANILFVGAPICSGSFTCTNLWSIFANGAVRATSFTSTTGATLGGGVVSINNNSSSAVNICTGSCSAGVNIGSGSSAGTNLIGNSAGGATNLASIKTQIGGIMWASVTLPVVTSGLGTSPAITAANTAAFEITTGSSGTPSTTVVLAMPTATNGWACEAHDVTTPADVANESAYSTNSVTFTFSIAPSLSDKIVFICGAF